MLKTCGTTLTTLLQNFEPDNGGRPMDQGALIALLVFLVPMCFSPGPNNLLCAAHGAQHGFRATLPLTLGMLVGWSVLGVAVGSAALTIESNIEVFEALTYAGAAYIAYLGITLARSPVKKAGTASETERLGFSTGAALQLVNGKAWVHFLALIATWGTLFGTGFMSKVLLVAVNALAGYPAVLVWSLFGSRLNRLMTSPAHGKRLNVALGASLVAVAVWVAMPH